MASEGGTILGVKLGDTRIEDPNGIYASGFFIHDVASKSEYIHVGGSLIMDTNVISVCPKKAIIETHCMAKLA